MKNSRIYKESEDYEIPPFDFDNSMPNKFAKLYTEDNLTIILKSNDLKTIVLDTDIADYFPDSRSVNFALRSILKAIPTKNKNKLLNKTAA
jgi:hypothetical protein